MHIHLLLFIFAAVAEQIFLILSISLASSPRKKDGNHSKNHPKIRLTGNHGRYKQTFG
ncbi:hypothetical protein RB653_010077 [Dictyostelium firmibasis]|uniref:Uncharacterized protein n=1 Tax=Dictyostelium firmibasis TaxID=79012 RepID=A0AAN7TTG6_9MYCE